MLPNTKGTNIVSGASTTTTFKSSAGFLSKIIINTPVALGTLTVYDNTAASGTKIGTLALIAAVGNPMVLPYEINFSTGLTIVSTVAGLDFTVVYA